MAEAIFVSVFVFMWLTYVWETYLSYRQVGLVIIISQGTV